MKRRTDSASRRSCSAVDPTRSAKTIVTTLRAAASSTALATREAPQASQNCASGLPSAPHAGQRGASGLPQPPQNRAPAPCALPQLLQFITTPGWRTSSRPVLRPEATQAAELPDVVAHQHNPERKRMRRDLHVMRTDDRSAPFQGGADLAVDERGVGAEVDALHVGQEDVEPLVITPLVGALLRTESQLRDSNGADGQVLRGARLNSVDHLREPGVEVVDADVGVEEILHSIEVRTGLGRRRLFRIGKLTSGTRQIEEGPAPATPRRFQD